MGVIIDTSILIDGERRGLSVLQTADWLTSICGETDFGISVVTAIELVEGAYQGKSLDRRTGRLLFAEELFATILTYPFTLDIARVAGRISGTQASLGYALPFEDLLIGATALHLSFSVLTLNLRHFETIPCLSVASV